MNYYFFLSGFGISIRCVFSLIDCSEKNIGQDKLHAIFVSFWRNSGFYGEYIAKTKKHGKITA